MSRLEKAHAPADAQCDEAFKRIVAGARKAGMPVTEHEQNGIATVLLGENGKGDEMPRAVWNRLMKDAATHCLIAQAYSGITTLATPAKQREKGVRDKILSAHARNEPEEICDQAFAEIVQEAKAMGALQLQSDHIAEVVEGKGAEWDALLEKAKKHALVATVVGNQDSPPRVFLFATPAAQRADSVTNHSFSHLRADRGSHAHTAPGPDPSMA